MHRITANHAPLSTVSNPAPLAHIPRPPKKVLTLPRVASLDGPVLEGGKAAQWTGGGVLEACGALNINNIKYLIIRIKNK